MDQINKRTLIRIHRAIYRTIRYNPKTQKNLKQTSLFKRKIRQKNKKHTNSGYRLIYSLKNITIYLFKRDINSLKFEDLNNRYFIYGIAPL